MATEPSGSGSAEDPWILKTPSMTSNYQAWRADGTLHVSVGSTKLSYQARAIDDLHDMLVKRADWVPLGNADEGKPVIDGTVEAWARSESNPVGGYYGLRKGYRGRFANYVTPILERLDLVELEHSPRNNRVRAKQPG